MRLIALTLVLGHLHPPVPLASHNSPGSVTRI